MKTVSRLIPILFIILSACQSGTPKELSHAQYLNWLKNENNTIKKSRSTNVVNITGEFRPSDVLAINEYKNTNGQTSFEAIRDSYECGLSFRITLESLNGIGNLLQYNVSDYPTYKKRVNYLNFNIDQFISLSNGKEKFKPIISHFEGYSELSKKLIFHVVFEPSSFKCGVFDEQIHHYKLTFDDPYWGSGINHFLFKTDHLENLPKIQLAQL